jgi:hypothetical protein
LILKIITNPNLAQSKLGTPIILSHTPPIKFVKKIGSETSRSISS